MENIKTNSQKRVIRTAILIDGGFYRKRATVFWGEKTPKERAEELRTYCMRHINDVKECRDLYRVFYYDCPPVDAKIYHPLLDKTVDLSKSALYKWSYDFFEELKTKRKFALRLGRLAVEQAKFDLRYESIKALLSGKKNVSDLTESDFMLEIQQKGVDMKIGVDISSLAYKHQVDQIILISGDSDFVPAAKLARREGIDFVLDPMRQVIKPDLFEHIDGLRTKVPSSPAKP